MSQILGSESTPKENDFSSAPSDCKYYLFYEVRPGQDMFREDECYLETSKSSIGNNISLLNIIKSTTIAITLVS